MSDVDDKDNDVIKRVVGSARDIDDKLTQNLVSAGLVEPLPEDYKLATKLDPDKQLESGAWEILFDKVYSLIHVRVGGKKTKLRRDALVVLMANIAAVMATEPRTWVRYSRSHQKPSTSLPRPFVYVLDGLIDLGLIEHRLGYVHLDSGVGRRSAFRATPQLRKLVDELGADPWEVKRPVPKGLIQVKDNDKILIKFKKTTQVRAMLKNLETINFMLDSAKVKLELPRVGATFPLRNKDTGPPEKGKHRGRHTAFDRFPYDISQRTLYRVFSRSSFERGGRFYGHWVQMIPSRFRRYVTLGGESTTEVDFSGMHIALLYAIAKKPIPNSLLKNSAKLAHFGHHKEVADGTWSSRRQAEHDVGQL